MTRNEEPAGKASRWPGPVRLLVQLALTALLTWLIVSQVGVTLEEALSLEAALPDPRPLPIAASTLLLLACFALTARLWGWMVRELGGNDPGWFGSLRIVLTANLGRYIPGKVWQVAGLALLSKRAGIPATLATGAAVLTQVFHLAGAAVVGMAVLGQLDGSGWGLRLGAPALLLLIGCASVPSLVRGGFRFAYRLAGLDPLTAPRPSPLFGPRWILLHTLVWLGYGVAFTFLVRGLGLEGSLVFLVVSFSAAYLMGYLAVFAPAGIGVREGVLIALLRPSLGGAAVGVAVLARVWMTLVELVPAGGFALWTIVRRGRPLEEDQRESTTGDREA